MLHGFKISVGIIELVYVDVCPLNSFIIIWFKGLMCECFDYLKVPKFVLDK